MKKKNIINLIKYHVNSDDVAFTTEVHEIAKEFDAQGDTQLAEYVMALVSGVNTFYAQSFGETIPDEFKKVNIVSSSLHLPQEILNDILGVVNAVSRNMGINKILLEGAPGTGKTEASKQIARILGRDLYKVDLNSIIDSKLGQTAKNLENIFNMVNDLHNPEKIVILFDEIDALALDRVRGNDLREMGRVTTCLFQQLDELHENVLLLATTNLYDLFDNALARRFDYVINFDRYSRQDLVEIGEALLNEYLPKATCFTRDVKIFRKILSIPELLPSPGILRNTIRTSIAFSSQDDEFGYLKILYEKLTGNKASKERINALKKEGFTVREIEKLSNISKSQVSRST